MNYINDDLLKYVRVVMCLTAIVAAFQTTNYAAGNKRKSPRNKAVKQTVLWQKTSDVNLVADGRRSNVPEKYQVFSVNQKLLTVALQPAPLEFVTANGENKIVFEVPTPEGGIAHFRLVESPMLAPEIAAQFPTWKTFAGQGIEDPTAAARFDINANGFHGYVVSANGTFLINPYAANDRTNYVVFYKNEAGDSAAFSCKFKDKYFDNNDLFTPLAAAFSNGTQLRNFRLAVSASKQYTNFFGGNQTNAFAAIQTTVNRLITVYRRELATTFTLVSGTNTVFTNANDGGFTNNSTTDTDRNQVILDQIIGTANYDIGHILSVTPNPDGLAASPSICSATAKAQGFTGSVNPVGDGFDVDYVAHEFGHQFGMSHTFNNDMDGSCTTRSADSAFEPASGVTIMGYGGICAPRNLSANSIEYFNIRSFDQALGNFQTATCGTMTATGNTPPTVSAPASVSVPRLTPFTLTATATDVNGDALTYLWEEFDLGTATRSTGAVDTDEDNAARPIFRAYNPTTQSSRSFPTSYYTINNANMPPLTYTGTLPFAPTSGSTNGYVCAPNETCVTGERLPSIARTMNFRVTVRDNNPNGGGIADAMTQVTVVNTPGAFRVTTQNSAANALADTWQAGTMQSVSWDVDGTDQPPFNVTNINILLSTDGGQTFPITLAANTPDDGSEPFIVPNTPTTKARIKVVPIGSIFFDVNDENFTITAPAASVSVSGRVINAAGRGIANVSISITDAQGAVRRVRTSSFGFYNFGDIPAGKTYVFTASSKKYSFTNNPRTIEVNNDLTDNNFVGNR